MPDLIIPDKFKNPKEPNSINDALQNVVGVLKGYVDSITQMWGKYKKDSEWVLNIKDQSPVKAYKGMVEGLKRTSDSLDDLEKIAKGSIITASSGYQRAYREGQRLAQLHFKGLAMKTSAYELDGMTYDADELVLFIENDSDLYRQKTMPIWKNYTRKMNKGVYDRNLAIKGMMYLVDEGAKKYVKEMDLPAAWPKVFPKEIRLEAAETLVDKFENDYEGKEFDFMKTSDYMGDEPFDNNDNLSSPNTQIWAFSESELQNPSTLNGNDELIASISDEDGNNQVGVIVNRDGTVVDRYDDGIKGISEEDKNTANDTEVLWHPQSNEETCCWREVQVDDDGNFIDFEETDEDNDTSITASKKDKKKIDTYEVDDEGDLIFDDEDKILKDDQDEIEACTKKSNFLSYDRETNKITREAAYEPDEDALLWLRIGDQGDYEQYNSLDEALEELDQLIGEDTINEVSLSNMNLSIDPQFTGQNYISIFWGDDEAQHPIPLNKDEKKKVLNYFQG